MADTLERAVWHGQPVSLGTAFELLKAKGSGQLRAVCSLHSHRFGVELRLSVNGELLRSQVCRSKDDALDTSEHWRSQSILRAACAPHAE
jgi:hypothetical protein